MQPCSAIAVFVVMFLFAMSRRGLGQLKLGSCRGKNNFAHRFGILLHVKGGGTEAPS